MVKPTSRKAINESSASQAKSPARDEVTLTPPAFRPVQLATLVDARHRAPHPWRRVARGEGLRVSPGASGRPERSGPFHGSKARRKGRVFVDYLRNQRGATLSKSKSWELIDINFAGSGRLALISPWKESTVG